MSNSKVPDSHVVANILHVLTCFDGLTLSQLGHFVYPLRTHPEILERLVKGGHVTVTTRKVNDSHETRVYSLRRTP